MSAERDTQTQGYFDRAKRPITILVFLLPLIVAYEIGAVVFLHHATSGGGEALEARRLLARIFEVFGVVGLHLPAFLLIVLLLAWQTLGRYPWRVEAGVIAGMWLEACLWTVPILLAGPALSSLGKPAAPLAPLAAIQSFSDLDPLGRLTIAIGAGVYEELVFRLVLIALVHGVAADIAKLSPGTAAGLAVALSSVVFAWYHGPSSAQFVFYLVAGAYFAGLYLWRGFGIAAATHVLYDAIALVLLTAENSTTA